MRSERSPVPLSATLLCDMAAACRSCSAQNNCARSTLSAFALFLCWLRSSCNSKERQMGYPLWTHFLV